MKTHKLNSFTITNQIITAAQRRRSRAVGMWETDLIVFLISIAVADFPRFHSFRRSCLSSTPIWSKPTPLQRRFWQYYSWNVARTLRISFSAFSGFKVFYWILVWSAVFRHVSREKKKRMGIPPTSPNKAHTGDLSQFVRGYCRNDKSAADQLCCTFDLSAPDGARF